MNKIYKKALQNTELRAYNLLSLIEYLPTEQQEVAMHIVLGEYEAPHVNEQSEKLGKNYTNTFALSYNPLTNEVTFQFNPSEIKSGWIANELIEKGGEISVENFISTKYWVEDAMSDIKFEGTRQDFNRLFTKHDIVVGTSSRVETSKIDLDKWQ